MSSSRTKTALTLLAGAVIGGAFGFAAGMLLAPDKGSVTRKKVKDTLDSLAEEFTDKVEEMVDQFGEVVDDAQEVMEDKIHTAKEKVKSTKEKFEKENS